MTDLLLPSSKPRPDYSFGLWTTLIFAVTLFPRIYLHIPWRDELHSWVIASDKTDLMTMLGRIRYEGHPSLWYLLVRPVSRIWDNPMSMQLMHGCISCITIFLLAAFFPAPRWQRALLCCGYFFLFEHAVIARNYAPGIAALIGFTIVLSRSPRSYIAAGVLLLIAINSNAMAAILSVALSIWVGIRWLKEGRPLPARFCIGVTIVVVGFLCAFLQMRAPPGRDWADTITGIDHVRAGKMVAAIYRPFVPLPSPIRDWWSTNILDFQPVTNKLNAIQGVLGIVAYFGIPLLLPKRRDVRTLWFIGATIIVVFGYVKYVGSLRHHSHFFVLFLIGWWLSRPDTRTDLPTQGERRAAGVFSFILVANAAAGLIASVADMVLPFTASRAAAQYVATNYPTAAMMGHTPWTTVPITQINRKQIYLPKPDEWASFMVWNRQRIGAETPDILTRAAAKLTAQDPSRPVLLVISGDSWLEAKYLTRFKEVARFLDATVETERYVIFEYVPQ